jgi:hypothetical protein
MNTANVWFICVAVVLSIGCISYWTAQANIEDSKQEAFMMKACVDAGGEWSKSWNRIPSCLRHK